MKPIIFILICIGLFTSCASEKSVIQEEDRLVTLSGLSDTQWTYISLSTGEVVGTSPLNSTEDDAHWRLRTDCDMAVCGKYIRTNSGTSGVGQGGIQSVLTPYEELTTLPAEEFKVDVYTNK